ncbi:MAG: GNAT family N-acetyltransferase [Ruminococcaceae bacterium]|nr:GNAT family N-acetyltransferase [Oscillospiraceae bacterium]
MNYVWCDYNPNTMGFVENWLDESAVKSTGLDEGFRTFYEYWVSEDGFDIGKNFWCKVAFENDKPFAVIAFCLHESKTIIMEMLIAPSERNQGKGSKILKEFIHSEEIIGFAIEKCEAVIYPSNMASKKAFENAGFIYCNDHKDENGDSMLYIYKAKPLTAI